MPSDAEQDANLIHLSQEYSLKLTKCRNMQLGIKWRLMLRRPSSWCLIHVGVRISYPWKELKVQKLGWLSLQNCLAYPSLVICYGMITPHWSAKKSYEKMWVIKCLKNLGASRSDLLEVYFKQIRCHAEYAVPVWNGSLTGLNAAKIERSRSLHFILSLEMSTHPIQKHWKLLV